MSVPFFIAGQKMNKNTPTCSSNYTHRIGVSVHKCHSSELIFKIIIQIQFQEILLQSSKWSSEVGKQTPAQVFFCEFSKMFQNIIFTKHLDRFCILSEKEKHTLHFKLERSYVGIGNVCTKFGLISIRLTYQGLIIYVLFAFSDQTWLLRQRNAMKLSTLYL